MRCIMTKSSTMLAMFTASLLIAAVAHAHAISPNTWALVRVEDPIARCLDGSAAAFYVRLGSKANSGKWIVHLEGGGWATDLGGSFARSQVMSHKLRQCSPHCDLHRNHLCFLSPVSDCARRQRWAAA